MGRKAGIRTQYTIERDKKIVEMLADGKSQQEIADALFLSPWSVCQLIKNILKEKKARTQGHLIAICFRQKEIA